RWRWRDRTRRAGRGADRRARSRSSDGRSCSGSARQTPAAAARGAAAPRARVHPSASTAARTGYASWLSVYACTLLVHPCTLPRDRGVAAVALAPVLPDVHVVLLMAREAILLELHFVRRPQVAGLAGELTVRTGEGKSGLLAVVELPHFPAVRGVASSAVLAQIALVHVVLAMAVDTLLADVAVLARQMTLLAWNRDVQAHQRKAREVVIEAHAGAPARRRVALIAFLAELTGVHVVRPVAAHAFGGQLLRRHARGMAGMTRDLLVTADEGPLGVARMVKARGLPLLVAMTGAAVLAEAAGVRVLRLVTAGALARQLVLEIARAVAVVAGDAVVHALERETGLLLVIELRVLPGAGDVTLGALDTPVAVVHVVRLVARDAFFGRIFITVAEVTGRAGRLTVLVPQWKRGLVVIVAYVAPGAGVVTGAAVTSQFALVGLLLAVAADALPGRFAVTLAGGVAALAHHVGVRAAQRIVGVLVIELLVTQLHDVRL